MFRSLKFRFITLLIFILFAILSLAIVQYNYSKKLTHFHESQLALKELQLDLVHMKLAESNFFLTHNFKFLDDIEVYANTIDIYFGIVDEYLQEFTYPEKLNQNIELYLDILMQIGKLKKHEEHQKLLHPLHTYMKKIDDYIENEQSRLMPIITSKIETITMVQNFIYLLMSLITVFMIIITFKPMITSILALKNFFEEYKSSTDRLNLNKLYFLELRDIGLFVNKMLKNQEEIQKEIILSRDEALRSQKVKDEFLSNMSHELRTPLNAIGGFSGVLLRKLPNEHEIIDPIIDSAAHLLQLVGDILDLSKIQSGKFEVVQEPFELYEELLSFTNRFTPLVNKKNIKLKFNYIGEKNITLMGDWFRISQILNNFMSNSIKFTSENGTIEFNAKYEDGVLYASIKDSGIGIKQEALSSILKPFEQSDNTITKKFGGTGLGLSIAKTLTDMMSGTFDIKSELEVGSTFSISIPLETMQTQERSTLVVKDEQKEDEVSISAHILIAEDNKTNQLLLSMLLDDLDITYDIANDGVEALNIFKENTYDIILMDENMPNLNGVESMLAIREKFKNIPPIIAVTANAMKGDRDRLIKLGMDDFLSKPIDNELLIETIKKNLDYKKEN